MTGDCPKCGHNVRFGYEPKLHADDLYGHWVCPDCGCKLREWEAAEMVKATADYLDKPANRLKCATCGHDDSHHQDGRGPCNYVKITGTGCDTEYDDCGCLRFRLPGPQCDKCHVPLERMLPRLEGRLLWYCPDCGLMYFFPKRING